MAQSIDTWTIQTVGIPSFTLMELAGSKAATQFLNDFPKATKLLFLIGKGNNAGDGLVMARHLLLSKPTIDVSLAFVFNEPPSTVDASKNWELLNNYNRTSFQDRLHLIEANSLKEAAFLDNFDLCIDAVFGVGLSRAIEEPLSTFFDAINTSALRLVALDVPSGLDAENGLILGTSLTVETTYTFGFDKIGFYLNDADHITGTVQVLPLGYDLASYLNATKAATLAPVFESLTPTSPNLLRTKKSPKHKYDGGAVLVLGSAEGLTGATISVAQAAWAAGASAVFVLLPKGLASIFESALPYAIKWLVGNDNDRYLTEKHLAEIKSCLASYGKKGSICMGPGLGQNPSTFALLNKVLPEITQALVIDADALKALTSSSVFAAEAATVLTPHLGEWQTIQKNYSLPVSSKEEITLAALSDVRNFALKKNVHLIRKGTPTAYFSPNGKAQLTTTPSLQALFNKTGFGDVLSGLLATALVRFNSTEEAVIWSLQKGLQAAKQSKMNQKTFFPETIIDYVKYEE